MESHQMEPPGDLWQRLEHAVSDHQKTAAKRHRRLLYWKSACAVAASVAIVSIAVYRLTMPVQKRVAAVADSLNPHVRETSPGNVLKERTAMAAPSAFMTSTVCQKTSVADADTANDATDVTAVSDTMHSEALAEGAVPMMAQAKSRDTAEKHGSSVTTKNKKAARSMAAIAANDNDASAAKPKQRLAASLYASSLGTSSQENASIVRYKYPYYTDMVMGSRKNVRMHHQMPIRLGLSLSYALNRSWAVETGLSYSRLRSDYNERDYFYDQTLHYVGVPLRVVYNVWSHRRFSLYAAAGGMLEKCVAGKAKEGYDDGKSQELRYSLDEKRWQWSVNASVGLQYKLASFAGIYVEPGVSHYFDNASSLSNIYKDSPTRFSLQIGLRFMP